MSMLTNLEGTLTQTTIGVGRVTFPSKRPMTGQYGVLMEEFKVFIHFIFSILISGDSAFHYIGMIMFISLEGTLTQTRIGSR